MDRHSLFAAVCDLNWRDGLAMGLPRPTELSRWAGSKVFAIFSPRRASGMARRPRKSPAAANRGERMVLKAFTNLMEIFVTRVSETGLTNP